jgi:hypothetical protein
MIRQKENGLYSAEMSLGAPDMSVCATLIRGFGNTSGLGGDGDKRWETELSGGLLLPVGEEERFEVGTDAYDAVLGFAAAEIGLDFVD